MMRTKISVRRSETRNYSFDEKQTFSASCTRPRMRPVPFGPQTNGSFAARMPYTVHILLKHGSKKKVII